MVIYAIHDLVKVYPGQTRPANKNITLDIQQGQVFGLLGDNGAGKSTLVRQMVNLTRSTSGSITLLGHDIRRNAAVVTANVGYMPQEGQALNNLTVGEALYFTAHLRGLSRADALRERDRLAEAMQLASLRDQIVPRLSGGQKRLLQIAIAMAARPPVLILDEPTNNLDPQRRKLVWDTLREVNQHHGATIMFITHDAIEAEKVIQRVGILREGELVAIGRPSELKQRVDKKLRLELFFSPDAPPTLPAGLAHRVMDAGRWLVLLDADQVTPVIHQLDLNRLDDFRLYSATLEDLYLHYAQQPT